MSERKSVSQEAAEALQKAGLTPFLFESTRQRIIAIIDATIKEREAARQNVGLAKNCGTYMPQDGEDCILAAGHEGNHESIQTPTPVPLPK